MKKLMMIIIFLVMIFLASASVSAPAPAPGHSKLGGKVGVYDWGQNGPKEGTLASVCSRYSYGGGVVIINANLTNLGYSAGRTPELNLAGHCDLTTKTCRNRISNDIRFCQKLGIIVLVIIGNYSLASSIKVDNAKNVSLYLWNNFLACKSESRSIRPLGDAVPDGFVFIIPQGGSDQLYLYHHDLAFYLKNYASSWSGKNIILVAVLRCPPPGTFNSGSVFDYVQVAEVDNPNSSRRICDNN